MTPSKNGRWAALKRAKEVTSPRPITQDVQLSQMKKVSLGSRGSISSGQPVAAVPTELYGKLNEIEVALQQVLAAQKSAVTQGIADANVQKSAQQPSPNAYAPVGNMLAPAWFSNPSPDCEGALEAVEPRALTAREQARLEFGREMLETLGLGVHGVNAVRLQVARKLPTNSNSGNSFRNDFSFDPDTRILSIRQDRVQHADELASVITHAASHIKVNPQDLSNDSEPAFVTELHRSVGLLSRQLFQKRMDEQKDGAQDSLSPSLPTPSPVASTSSNFFDAGNLHQRLQAYGLMASSQDELQRAFTTIHGEADDGVFDLLDDEHDATQTSHDQYIDMLQRQIREAEIDLMKSKEQLRAADNLLSSAENSYRQVDDADEATAAVAKTELHKAKAEVNRLTVQQETKTRRLRHWQQKLETSKNIDT